MEKTLKPLEVVDALTKAIKDELQKHADNSVVVVTDAGVKLEDPAKNGSLLVGQDSSHSDALEHHATLAAAQFHAGNEELSKTHRDLAVAHAGLIGVDAEKFLNAVYGQFEGMSVPEEFIPHGKDAELEKKAPSFEAFDDASGAGVDKKHVGKTPDDQKPKLVNDPQKEKVKKEEDSEESTTETAEKKEVSESLSKGNLELLAHQLGLFKVEPILGGANSPLGTGAGNLEGDMKRPTPTPTPLPKSEESTSTEDSKEEVEKAGEFKSKQIQSIRQSKGYTRARPQMKEELSSDQQLDGKGKPDGDPKTAVLNKDKK